MSTFSKKKDVDVDKCYIFLNICGLTFYHQKILSFYLQHSKKKKKTMGDR